MQQLLKKQEELEAKRKAAAAGKKSWSMTRMDDRYSIVVLYRESRQESKQTQYLS
jgi:hypothetical protein